MTVVNFSSNSTLDTTRTDLITVRPKLLLDFSNSTVLDPRITFTRSSGATRINARGLVETVGTNTPRFDYDPATLACKGLLIEEQRTNTALYTNSVYFPTGFLRQYRNQTAPDGTSGAVNYKGTGYCIVSNNAWAANTSYTVSIWARLISGTAPTAGTLVSLPYDNNGYTVAKIFYSAITLTSAWKRFSITVANINATTQTMYINADASPDAVIGLWGLQIEAGAFASSYTPPVINWTSRASSATYVAADGFIKTATSNVVRYQYNPLNLSTAPYLLVEPAGSNYLSYSEQFDNAIWDSRGNTTITPNAITAPNGTLTGWALLETTTTTVYHYQNRPHPKATLAVPFTFSIYVKYKGREVILGLSDSAGTSGVSTRFNLLTGTISSAAGAYGTVWAEPDSSILPVGNDWYRISVTANTDASNIIAIQLAFYNTAEATNVYTGDGTSGVYIWGAQLENSYSPSSYMLTTVGSGARAADVYTVAQATRAADIAVMTGTNFSNWYNPVEGTLYAESSTLSTLTGAQSVALFKYPRLWQIESSSADSAVYWYGTQVELYVGGTYNNIGTVPLTINKLAVALSSIVDQSATSLNGAAAVIRSGALGGSATLIGLGNDGAGGAGSILNGHLSRIIYYNRRLSNTQIQQLTS